MLNQQWSLDVALDPPFVERDGRLEFKPGRAEPASLAFDCFLWRWRGRVIQADHIVRVAKDRVSLERYVTNLIKVGGQIVEGPGRFPTDFCEIPGYPKDREMHFAAVACFSGGIVVIGAPAEPNDQLGRFLGTRGSTAVHHVAIRVGNIGAATPEYERFGFHPCCEILEDRDLSQRFLRNASDQLIELIHRPCGGSSTFTCNNLARLRLAEDQHA